MTRPVSTAAVRRATAADAGALAAFGARTFVDAFGADNTHEDMAAYLAQAYGEAQQRAEIDDPSSITLLVQHAGAIIAFAQVRRGEAPPAVTGAAPVELRRFYVDRPWHGQGLAQALMHVTEQAARELGGRTFWLGVWERNARAIAFYAKCGFVDVGTQPFLLGRGRQTDRVMTRPL